MERGWGSSRAGRSHPRALPAPTSPPAQAAWLTQPPQRQVCPRAGDAPQSHHGDPPREETGREFPGVTLVKHGEHSHGSQQGEETRNWVCGTDGDTASLGPGCHAHHNQEAVLETSDPRGAEHPQAPGWGWAAAPLPPPCPTFPRCCRNTGLSVKGSQLAAWRQPSQHRGKEHPPRGTPVLPQPEAIGHGRGPAQLPIPPTAQSHRPALPASEGTATVALCPCPSLTSSSSPR